MIRPDELSGIPIFDCLSEAQRTRLAQGAGDLWIREGDWVIQEGELASFFVLLEGSMEVMKDYYGRSTAVNKYKRGDFFGEIPLLLGTPALASLRAKTVSRVMKLDRMQFGELIESSAECSAVILQTMTSRLTRLQEYARDMPSSRVLVLGSQYDTDCRDIRTFLTMNRIPYEWVDREREPERVPTCLTLAPGGPSVVVDRNFCVGQPPTVRKVAEALGLRTTPRTNHYDVIVVGGGPAGLAAAVYGASEGLSVLLIEKAAAGGQAGTSSRIENYLGFPSGISGDDLSERALKQAGKFGAEIVLTREVRNIAKLDEGYCVELDDGLRVSTRSVVLATGVEWRRLEADGIDRMMGRGVLYGASRTEASTVVGKDIFIVGGGNSAGQAAMFFSAYADTLTMLVRGPQLELGMSQYLVDQIASRCNISVETNTSVVSVGGEDHLETICTSTNGADPVTRKADALFVMIGADAKTDWLPRNLLRDERGYICTGRDLERGQSGTWNEDRSPFLLETSLPGIFCAGDVRHDSIKRVASGVGEGSMAIAFVHQYLALAAADAVQP